MKNRIRFAVTVLAALVCCAPLWAQRYEPTESWPYLYEDFSPGNVLTARQGTIGYRQLNVCVSDGGLYYIKEGTIMKADMAGIHTVGIGDEVYLNVRGRLMRVMAETEHCAVVRDVEVNTDEMAKKSIGYVRSAVASTEYIQPLEKSLLEAEKNKFNGRVLPLREHFYLVVDGQLIPAGRSEVLKWSGSEKQATQAFLKENKIKWSRPEDLARLGEFLHGLHTPEQ